MLTQTLAEETIQAHMKSIFAKLEVHDQTAALAIALRRGIVHLDDTLENSLNVITRRSPR